MPAPEGQAAAQGQGATGGVIAHVGVAARALQRGHAACGRVDGVAGPQHAQASAADGKGGAVGQRQTVPDEERVAGAGGQACAQRDAVQRAVVAVEHRDIAAHDGAALDRRAVERGQPAGLEQAARTDVQRAGAAQVQRAGEIQQRAGRARVAGGQYAGRRHAAPQVHRAPVQRQGARVGQEVARAERQRARVIGDRTQVGPGVGGRQGQRATAVVGDDARGSGC